MKRRIEKLARLIANKGFEFDEVLDYIYDYNKYNGLTHGDIVKSYKLSKEFKNKTENSDKITFEPSKRTLEQCIKDRIKYMKSNFNKKGDRMEI